MKIHGMIRWPAALIGILLTTTAFASEPEAGRLFAVDVGVRGQSIDSYRPTLR